MTEATAEPIRFLLNDEVVESRLPAGTVVLDFLRRERRLTGTKEGCREGDCGACTVLVGELTGTGSVQYRAVNSCLLPLGDLQGRHLVSIEGLNPPGGSGKAGAAADAAAALTPVQDRLVEHGAIQCGFCTPGFVVSLTAYLLGESPWSYEQAVQAAAGNICRCTGYASIKRAIADLLERLEQPAASADPAARLRTLVEQSVVPRYFQTIPQRLEALQPPRQKGSRRQTAQTRGPEQQVVGGGTDLFVQRPQALLEQPLAFVSGFPGLQEIRVEKKRLLLGAGISMEQVGQIPELRASIPDLGEILPLVASTPIRNRATLGGNIVNASPIGDFTVMLLALGAVLGLRGGGDVREVPLRSFFKGYKQLDLETGERLEWIVLPLEEGRFSFEKVSRRRYLDIASVNSAAWLNIDGGIVKNARLAAGGVAPIPLFLARASDSLQGREPGEETIEQALELAQEEAAPIDDVRGSADYKRLLLRQLLLAHFEKLLPRGLRAEVWM